MGTVVSLQTLAIQVAGIRDCEHVRAEQQFPVTLLASQDSARHA